MIVLDVETSGLIPSKHSILSIGALDFANPENQFYEECRIWDGAEVEEEALNINGFSREQITDEGRQTEAELIASFVAWSQACSGGCTLAAQNPSFDLEFVQAACERAGIACPFGKRTIDIHSVVWLHMQQHGVEAPVHNGRSAISLDTALSYCGIPAEPKPHNARTGALCHAEVLARIAYTKKIVPNFSTYDIPWETNR